MTARPDPADVDLFLQVVENGRELSFAEGEALAAEVVALRAELAEAREAIQVDEERIYSLVHDHASERAAREAAERERDEGEVMRVEATCSCGATLTVEYEKQRGQWTSDAQIADRLLEQFRRDHKQCRVNAAAVAATTGTFRAALGSAAAEDTA